MSTAVLRDGTWLTPARLHAYPTIVLTAWGFLAAAWIALSDGVLDPAGQVLGTDFLNVWAASAMALEGDPAGVYDWVRHAAVERRVTGPGYEGYFGWHYPPIFLLAAWPLALMPYGAALPVWLAATMPAYWTAVRSILGGRTAAVAALAFPAVWINLGHGQNGFLTAGLMGGGLVLLDRRPVLAGILFGLLSYKPQFGLLVPLALVATGRWSTVIAAAATVAALCLASLAVFGWETWAAFLASLHPTRTIVIELGATGWPKIQSVFSAVRMQGGSIPIAYSVQALAAVLAGAAVLQVWRRGPRDLAAAALVAATPLATPYVLDYDLVLLALPIAWLARRGLAEGFAPWEKTLLAALWILPMLARPFGAAFGIPLAPPLLAALLALIVLKSSRLPEARP